MKNDPSKLISSYKRRQQFGPFIIWGAVGVLVFAGVVFLLMWMFRPNSPVMMIFASPTPTSTATLTATSTVTVTTTPTETTTPTVTLSSTPSEPFLYTVQEGDYLSTIATKFNLGDNGVELIMYLNPYNATDLTGIDPATQGIFVGQVIRIPNPGMELPTPTPLPSNIAPGTEVLYSIRPGDTLQGIASKFNSTVEDIKKINEIVDDNSIRAGDQIRVRVNLVTPTPLPNPTITQGPSPTPPSPFTETPVGGVNSVALTATPTATLTPTLTVTP